MESLSNHMSSLGTFDVRRVAQLSVPHVRVNCLVVAVVHVDVAHNLCYTSLSASTTST